MVLAANLLTSVNLLLNGFALISLTTFRILTGIAVLVDLSALVVIRKKSEF